MLKVTRDLMDLCRQRRPDGPRVEVYLSFIEDYGGEEDAEALLDLYLMYPDAFRLLSTLRKIGGEESAERLFARCVENHRVKEGFVGDVFTTLAHMGYQPVEEVLYHRLRHEQCLDRDECVALLHFSCAGHEAVIREKILKYKNQHLFPEFHPLLASKIPDPDLPDLIYHWGTHRASTDCNGGLVLGLALYGGSERDRFKQILWDPRWEANGVSTGTIHWTFTGMQYLGITFRELFQEIKASAEEGTDEEEMGYRLFVLGDLLEHRIHASAELPLRFVCMRESCKQIYDDLENFIEWLICNEKEGYSDFYRAKDLLRMKLEQELRKEFVLREFVG
ncbi:MAG: hypothetical protein CW342_03820 [Thermoactinomycetaceae bacterium]|nr:hypothetical protein [Bacillota bacterium]MBO2532005.1 hypothetical protein [Thermoactinomycetaceae bacterium]